MTCRRSSILASLLAVGVCAILGTNRRDGEFADAQASFIPALDRRITSIHIHGVPADEAILQIQRFCDAKIVVRWNVAGIPIIDPQQVIWLDFQNVTVRQLLQAVTDQLQSGPAVDFDVQNDTIVIANQSHLPSALRIYNVDDFPTASPFGCWPHDDPELAMSLCLLERYWSFSAYARNSSDWAREDCGKLFVVQTKEAHEKVAAFLTALRQARPDGCGPSITRCRVVGGRWPQIMGRSWDTVVRFYDVRDICARSQYIVYYRPNPMQSYEITGIRALAYLVANRGRPNSWMFPGQIRDINGRLVVEHVAEVQDQVRQLLADVRAGKAIEGFRLGSSSTVHGPGEVLSEPR